MTLFEIVPSLQRAVTPRIDRAVWPVTTHVDELGRLCVGGVRLTEVAGQFRTPTYVIDETDFRYRICRYRRALPHVRIVYAGKALLTTALARWVTDEGLGLNVCSGGELATALAAGVDPKRIVMHGNAKTPDELNRAAAVGVGRIVVDSPTQIAFLAGGVRRAQSVLVRVTPDIDIHRASAVSAGLTDQKFGFALTNGDAAGAVERILDHPLLYLVGLHCDIGSQVTDASLYGEAIRELIPLMAELRARHGVILTELNIGGGHGIPYVSGDPELDLTALGEIIHAAVAEACAAERFPHPTIVVEPGRAISARAGVTVYRVLSVNSQPGGRTFVAVDGGMSDNPRAALYGGNSSVVLANRHPLAPTQPMTVVGRHCESGDEIARDVPLPIDIHPGDLLAVACTGAYHHSMASTYNMVGRPPLVAVNGGRTRELVRRETIADLLSRDRGWAERPQTTQHQPPDGGCEALLHGE
jgi:diaminopimelate decarboxylase